MTEQEYRALPNDQYFSSSLIKNFELKGPTSLIKSEDISKKKGVRFGRIAHHMALLPDTFEDFYRVSEEFGSVADSHQSLTSVLLLEHTEDKSFTIQDVVDKTDAYINAAIKVRNELGLWKNITKEETIKIKLTEQKLIEYLVYTLKHVDDNRAPITADEYLNACLIAKGLRESPFTSKFFDRSKTEDTQSLFEKIILFKIDKNEAKSMLDQIFLNHKQKTIQFIDLKTTSYNLLTIKDINSFIIDRLDHIQAGFYTKALEEFISKNNLSEYEVLHPIYIYVNLKEPTIPIPYAFPKNLISLAFRGGKFKGEYREGIFSIIDSIKRCRKNGIYHYPPIHLEYLEESTGERPNVPTLYTPEISYARPYPRSFWSFYGKIPERLVEPGESGGPSDHRISMPRRQRHTFEGTIRSGTDSWSEIRSDTSIGTQVFDIDMDQLTHQQQTLGGDNITLDDLRIDPLDSAPEHPVPEPMVDGSARSVVSLGTIQDSIDFLNQINDISSRFWQGNFIVISREFGQNTHLMSNEYKNRIMHLPSGGISICNSNIIPNLNYRTFDVNVAVRGSGSNNIVKVAIPDHPSLPNEEHVTAYLQSIYTQSLFEGSFAVSPEMRHPNIITGDAGYNFVLNLSSTCINSYIIQENFAMVQTTFGTLWSY